MSMAGREFSGGAKGKSHYAGQALSPPRPSTHLGRVHFYIVWQCGRQLPREGVRHLLGQLHACITGV